MVSNYKETVRFDKKTVAFRKATDWLKTEKAVKYNEIEAEIGLKEGQMDMVRAFRRRVQPKEIKMLTEKYPETEQFFIEELDTQTLNEPISTHFYGKQDPWQELVETQKKLIERLEIELTEVKERLMVVEAEKKTLVDIVSRRK